MYRSKAHHYNDIVWVDSHIQGDTQKYFKILKFFLSMLSNDIYNYMFTRDSTELKVAFYWPHA